jgi:hypothetical protein
MIKEITALEEVLNKEIEAYSNLEKYLSDKKDVIVKRDVEKLKYIDLEIQNWSEKIQTLDSKLMHISSDFEGENLTLNQIIERIENEQKQSELPTLKNKLKNIADKTRRQNKINLELLENAMKLIENSVNIIANAIVPEISSYNKRGRKIENAAGIVSSIVHEA